MIVAYLRDGLAIGTVAQRAQRDFRVIRSNMAQRWFNLARLAHAILDQPDFRVRLRKGRRRDELAAPLVAAQARRAFSDAALLVEANNADRLGVALKPFSDGTLEGWTLNCAERLRALVGWQGHST